ncbi:efflux RND transporter permease subunit [Pseudomonas aeruginosa]
MVGNRVSANLMSLRRVDFGIIVDGAVMIVENAIRRLAHAQAHHGRQLTARGTFQRGLRRVQGGAPGAGLARSSGGVPADLRPHRGRGKMFHPMAFTRGHRAARAMILW